MSTFTSARLKNFIWSDFSISVTEIVTKKIRFNRIPHKFHVELNSSPREGRLGNFKNVE